MFCTPISRPSQTSARETNPLESPLSQSDIGCMGRLAILPVPECRTPLFCGVDDPVRI